MQEQVMIGELPVDSKESGFEKELSDLLNKYSKENDSDTPDFILAKYIFDCLTVFSDATRTRDKWLGRKLNIISEVESNPATK